MGRAGIGVACKAGRLEKTGGRWTFEPEIAMKDKAPGMLEQRLPFIPAHNVVLRVHDKPKTALAA
jgi:hypothetical protein